MDKELLAHIGFSHCSGIGPLSFRLLLAAFNSAQRAYGAREEDLKKLLGDSLSRRFLTFRRKTDLSALYKTISEKRIKPVFCGSPDYPDTLRELSDPPICLYVKGDTAILRHERLYAIVGTRSPTAYGTQLARHFSSELASQGFVIVSGMALGIDALAHWGALEAKGKTIAVLGCGVDIVYPASNRALYDEIIRTGGAVISEFPPGHLAQRGLFVVRNRIVTGLSQGLLVVEGTERSGTLTTAKYAADQGKPVFAPPSPINSQVSQAPNLLLKQGAVLVTDIEDILREFGIRKQKKITFETGALGADEKRIVELLQREESSIDEMVARLQLPSYVVATALSGLEIQSLIEKDDTGKYRLHLG